MLNFEQKCALELLPIGVKNAKTQELPRALPPGPPAVIRDSSTRLARYALHIFRKFFNLPCGISVSVRVDIAVRSWGVLSGKMGTGRCGSDRVPFSASQVYQ